MIDTLGIVIDDIKKLKEKYEKKAEKERAKVNDVYIIIQGEKVYTEEEIMDWYAGDCITSTQADRYEEKLAEKRKKAGENNSQTKSEKVLEVLKTVIVNLEYEKGALIHQSEEKKARDERWERAKAQGMSYSQWLELEEILQRSEDYERMMGL